MEERDWSDIPHHILSLIVARLLTPRDVTSFYGVCGSWRSLPFPVWWYPKSKMTQFPLLVCPRTATTLLELYHPMSHHPIYKTVYGTTKERTMIINAPELANAIIRFSKYGWLLMSHGERAMFFFNPFTKEKIDLPDLPMNYHFNGIAFSSPPTSPDCVIFGIRAHHPKYADYNFIRRGEKKWNRLEADNNYDFAASPNNPVFHNGVFYCIGLKGNLGVFNPNKEVENCWKVLTNAQPCNSVIRRYLAECDGNLISIFTGDKGKWVKVFIFEYSSKAWKEVRSLGKNMLFLSTTTSFGLISLVSPTALEINKIYFPMFHKEKTDETDETDKTDTDKGVFYSLETRKFHTFGKYAREDYYETKEEMCSTWIQPNYEVHTDEELQWCLPLSDSSDTEDY